MKDTYSLVYLDRIRSLYPHGVAEAMITLPEETLHGSQQGVKKVRFVLCVVSQTSQPLSAESEALIEAICTKGLGLTMTQCEVRAYAAEQFSEDIFLKDMQSCPGSVAVLMGDISKPNSVTVSSALTVLRTYSLEKIAGDAEVKRAFWKQLQASILPLLRVTS